MQTTQKGSHRRLAAAASAAVMAAAMLPATTAGAQEKRLSLGLAETHAFYQPLVAFGEALEAAGVSNTVFSLQVLGVAEASSGFRDGIVDGGLLIYPYFANEYSEANLTAELSMLATSGSPSSLPGAAMNGAALEYILLNCPECLEQFKAQNQVYVAAASTTDYALICNKPVAKLGDMAGLRVRSGAGNYARIAAAVGATSVTMRGNEVFDALGKGVVDCTMQPAASVLDFRYIEVTNSLLLGFPGGVFSGTALPSFNRDSWQSLTTEQRAAAIKAGAQLAAAAFYNNRAMDVTSIEAARAKGFTVSEADDELKAKLAEFVTSDLATIEAELTTKFGLKDAGAKIAKMRELVEKWKGLTNDPAMDEAKLAQLYWDQVFSKVDPATHGMN